MREVVLVAGGTSGIGKEVINQLSKNYHYKIYGTSRSEQKNGWNTRFLVLDVTSEKSMQELMDKLRKKEFTVHVLVNAIETNMMGSCESTQMSEVHHHMNVNFYGSIRLIKHVLPYMKQQRAGKIIHINQVSDKIALPFDGAYAASKTALVAYIKALHYEVKRFGVHVSLVEPNECFTEEYKRNMKKIKYEMRDYEQVAYQFFQNIIKPYDGKMDNQLMAETVLQIIESKNPEFLYQVGKKTNKLMKVEHFLEQRRIQQRLEQEFLN